MKRIRVKRNPNGKRAGITPPCLLRIECDRHRQACIAAYKRFMGSGDVTRAENLVRMHLKNDRDFVPTWRESKKYQDKFLSATSHYSQNKTDPKYFEPRSTEKSGKVKRFSGGHRPERMREPPARRRREKSYLGECIDGTYQFGKDQQPKDTDPYRSYERVTIS